MEIITSLKKEELEQLIIDSVNKCLNGILKPPQELPDRCGIDEACIILGTPEKPASKAKVYQLTHLKKLPFMHYGRILQFSKRALLAYREANTVTPFSPEDEMKANLIKSAEKKLRNEK